MKNKKAENRIFFTNDSDLLNGQEEVLRTIYPGIKVTVYTKDGYDQTTIFRTLKEVAAYFLTLPQTFNSINIQQGKF